MKKIVCALLVAMLLAGCTNSKSDSEQSSKESGASSESSKVVDLSVELFDRANTPADQGTVDNNRWTKYIQEEMLKKGVNVTFQTIPRGEEVTKLNVLMASGTAPDISFTYDRNVFIQYANDGGLNDLGPSVEEFGENIQKRSETDILKYGKINDKQYSIPANRAGIMGVTPHYSSFIRKDWVEKVGMEMPTNRDELVEVLRAFKEKDPSGKGEALIPFSVFGSGFGSEATEHLMYDAAYSFMENSEELDYTTPAVLRDGMKEFLQWMNELYTEGLIDPNFAAGTSTIDEVKKGNVGFFMDGWWAPYQGADCMMKTLGQIEPEAEIAPVDVWQNSDGDYIKTGYLPIGMYIFSPKSNENIDAAVKYIDFMSQNDVGMMLNYGIEGEHYSMDEGFPKALDITYNQKTLGYINSDISIPFNGGMPFADDIRFKMFNDTYYPYGDLAIESVKISASQSRPYVVFDKVIETQQKYGTEITTVNNEYWAKLIMSTAFDSDWDAYMKALDERGIKEIAAERSAYYADYIK